VEPIAYTRGEGAIVNDYENVGATSSFPPGSMRLVKVGNLQVVVANVDGRLHAFQSYCPHAGAPLTRGRLSDGEITCPLHGGVFDIETGDIVDGPSLDKLPIFDVRVEDDQVLVEKRDPWGGKPPPHLFVSDREGM
jgi:nitrite reductase/ring-hydroxylating ferredoxin subunit